MDAHKQLLIANGEDKTDSVESYRFESGKCRIKYYNFSKIYSYNASNIQILNLQRKIDPQSTIVVVKGRQIVGIKEILDFGKFYRIVKKDKRDISYRHNEIQLINNCLSDKRVGNLFDYFRETAATVSLITDKGINILNRQYQKVTSVRDDTVLASYLDTTKEAQPRKPQSLLIYPFGLNQSQKQAVENAFSSQISIIQGPPGTGKTQTILNIIANAVLNNKTVAVVSNNNSATLNVAEKLEKNGLSFIAAFLGSSENKKRFLAGQCSQYPDISKWVLEPESERELSEAVGYLSAELNEMLNRKNRIAEIKQELLELQPEQYYFNEYYSAFEGIPESEVTGLSSQKILSLWLEYERHFEEENKLGLLKKLYIIFQFNRFALNLFDRLPELVIPYLQNQFYITKKAELYAEQEILERELANYSFDAKMEELSQKSLKLFRAKLAKRYPWHSGRQRFEMNDLRGNSEVFNQEYPVILSTTYSIKETLSVEHIYDYLIIDEATQVDLATGVLAFSCAKNIVIVGDLKQLPNIPNNKKTQILEEIWNKYSFDEIYNFTKQSLLSSAIARWNRVPSVMLREHYRCHPKIIGFCNQKFYQNQLIIMTKDHGEENVLTTVSGAKAIGLHNAAYTDIIAKDGIDAGPLTGAGFTKTGLAQIHTAMIASVAAKYGGMALIIIIMSLLGFAAYFNGIGVKIRQRAYEISVLRAVGAPISRLRLRLLIDNIKLPIIAGVLSVISVKGVQMLMAHVYYLHSQTFDMLNDPSTDRALKESLRTQLTEISDRYFLDRVMWVVPAERITLIIVGIM